MKDITENELDEIENFVKIELEQRLQEKCERLKNEISELEKENFFGLYASSVKEFKLLRGERKLLLKIASHLTELYEKDKIRFKIYFDTPKRFNFKNDVVNGPAGLFFGKKCRKQTNVADLNPNDLKCKLFVQLKKFFNSFKELKPVRSISNDLIEMIDLNPGYRADLICVFCPSNDSNIEALI